MHTLSTVLATSGKSDGIELSSLKLKLSLRLMGSGTFGEFSDSAGRSVEPLRLSPLPTFTLMLGLPGAVLRSALAFAAGSTTRLDAARGDAEVLAVAVRKKDCCDG